MKLILLGAAGSAGRRILKFALESGHQVAAFVRDQNKIADVGTAATLGRAIAID